MRGKGVIGAEQIIAKGFSQSFRSEENAVDVCIGTTKEKRG
jgi:hypothetical protein